MKLSVETPDRIRELGGDTCEDTIVEALDDRIQIVCWFENDAEVG